MILIRRSLCKDDFNSSLSAWVFLSFTFTSAVKMFCAALIFNLFWVSSHCEFNALLSRWSHLIFKSSCLLLIFVSAFISEYLSTSCSFLSVKSLLMLHDKHQWSVAMLFLALISAWHSDSFNDLLLSVMYIIWWLHD